MHLSRIGLTGGIGSGKSTTAQLWRERGAVVIDLDVHSRAVLDMPGDGVEEAIARFGEEYRASDGTVDRGALARLVFTDAAARADLEEIVLTRVEEAVAAEEQQAQSRGVRFIVHDSPLLLEKGHDRTGRYAEVVAVIARREDRIERVMRSRRRDRAYVESVMAAQVTDPERIRRATRLLLNTAGQDVLRERAGALLDALRAEHDAPGS